MVGSPHPSQGKGCNRSLWEAGASQKDNVLPLFDSSIQVLSQREHTHCSEGALFNNLC